MKGERGLFIVFEGIDRSGKSTHVHYLAKHIQDLDKYNNVLLTHEPWRSEDIKRKLEYDADAYSDGLKMAELFTQDRRDHVNNLILPNLEQGVYVICDRFKASTCAYQSAQGIQTEKLFEMQSKIKIVPDITFLLDIDPETALKRGSGKTEKFEKVGFLGRVRDQYLTIVELSKCNNNVRDVFGEMIVINSDQSVEDVDRDLIKEFDLVYNRMRNFK